MKINYKYTTIILSVWVITLTSVVAALAGANLDSPGGPTEAGSQMYTLEQIYDRLTTGAADTKMTAFTEPGSGPGTGTMHTLNEIMAEAPALDNTNGATTAQVLSGTTFWGLTGSQWATQTGTMPNNGAGSTIVPTTTDQSVAAGYWSSANTVQGDSDLVAGNIAQGVNLFGVEGTFAPCDCTGGTLNGTRWCDNGDGTVTDLLGYNGVGQCLEWAQDASWGGVKYWRNSSTDCSPPNYTCYDNVHMRASAYGGETENWRLPTRAELYALTHGTEQVLSDTPRAFTGVQPYYYWSSTSAADDPRFAWSVYLVNGVALRDGKILDGNVWPVRSGQ